MKKKVIIILILGLVCCKMNKENFKTEQQIEDNTELIEIHRDDQADRQTDHIQWSFVSRRDSLRQVRIHQLLDSNKVRTSKDYRNAAMIFQHGRDSVAYGMAVKLMRKSIELDSTANKWLLAAAIDRNLLSRNKPQIYGTQYFRMRGKPWELRDMDTTQISDIERIEYGVETLAEQKEKVKRMNRKKISELFNKGKAIEEIIEIIKTKSEPEYDISEIGINSFGYNLLRKNDNENALKIFKLNTELYPNEFNTWDSLGECLLALGNKKDGINAYKKSLKLNPKNKNAQTIIEKNQ